jgi:diguanylate cyclase (GGDEF)-like protein
LIAEDDPVSRRLLEVTLHKWGYEVIACPDGTTAWQILQCPDTPSLAILDWMMPGMDGLQVCREVRQQAAEPYIYVLLLTAKSQKTDIIAGLEAGADDYLTKPFDANELRMRLRAGRRILDLQSELILVREALRDQATHDSLTHLWNRATIYEILQRELDHIRRTNTTLSVILVDIDYFKRINDTYGHLIGDAVLRETAHCMQAVLRPYDNIGRYGGEEFLLVLPECDTAGAMTLAERLRTTIATKALTLVEGMTPLTVSLGVATSSLARETESLISAADTALYRAKNNGRNRVELATVADATAESVLKGSMA